MSNDDLDLKDEDLPIEKKDILAMWIAGVLTVGLPIIGMLVLIIGIVLLLFGN